MKKEPLELTIINLKKAVQRLREATALSLTRIHRDATIQRFEFCFELAWKTLKIFLSEQGIECQSPKDCYRRAADAKLINDPKLWFGYLKARNLTAHTYNEKIAARVYKKAKGFPQAVKDLLGNLEKMKD